LIGCSKSRSVGAERVLDNAAVHTAMQCSSVHVL